MIGVVLDDKKALLTEDRVKNLTKEQLMFHYAEIMIRRKEEEKKKSEKLKNILDVIDSMMINAGIIARTDLKWDGIKQNIDKRQAKKISKEQLKDEGQQMYEEYQKLSQITPETLTVDDSFNEPKQKLPTAKRVGGGKRGKRKL